MQKACRSPRSPSRANDVHDRGAQPTLAPWRWSKPDADRLRRVSAHRGAALGKRLRELDRKDAKGHKGSTGAKDSQSDGESPLVTGPRAD